MDLNTIYHYRTVVGLPEDPCTDGMESANCNCFCVNRSNQFIEPVTELVFCTGGEGDDEDCASGDTVLDHPGHPAYDNAGLAAESSGDA